MLFPGRNTEVGDLGYEGAPESAPVTFAGFSQSAHDAAMKSYTLAQAKAHLSTLIDLVEAGEAVTMTRCGKEVARVPPPEMSRCKIDAEELRALTDQWPLCETDAGEFMRKMRDEERY